MKQIIFLFFIPLFLHAKSYYVESGEMFNVEPQLLWVIDKTEFIFDTKALNKNKNGTYDIGIMQINSIHLPELKEKYNIKKEDLYNPRVNIHIGAMILKRCLDKHKGNLTNGVTCYNGRIKDNPYGKKVLEELSLALETYNIKENNNVASKND